VVRPVFKKDAGKLQLWGEWGIASAFPLNNTIFAHVFFSKNKATSRQKKFTSAYFPTQNETLTKKRGGQAT